jgi:hypothetical protein
MVIPDPNNFSVLHEFNIVMILFGFCEPFLNVFEIH